MEEDLDSFLENNASQKKRSMREKKLSFRARQGSKQDIFRQTFVITA